MPKQTKKRSTSVRKSASSRKSAAAKSRSTKSASFSLNGKGLLGKKPLLIFAAVFGVIGLVLTLLSHAAVLPTPEFFLRNSNSAGYADVTMTYGVAGMHPFACRVGANAATTIAQFDDGAKFYLRNTNTSGNADLTFTYGNPGDKPLCGNWDGLGGTSTVGVYRPSNSTFYLKNTNASGYSDVNVAFGNPGDLPIACDFNGDGKTDIGVYRPSNSTFYLSYTKLGIADISIPFGNPGDVPLCGKWSGGVKAGVGVYRPSNTTFYLSDTIAPSVVNHQFIYGNPGDTVLVGDWDGNGTTTVAVGRNTVPPAPAPAPTPAPAAPATKAAPKSTYTCVGTTVIEVASKEVCIAILTYGYAGHPELIARQIAASALANAGYVPSTAPIPAPTPTAPTPAPTPTVVVGTPPVTHPTAAEIEAYFNLIRAANPCYPNPAYVCGTSAPTPANPSSSGVNKGECRVWSRNSNGSFNQEIGVIDYVEQCLAYKDTPGNNYQHIDWKGNRDGQNREIWTAAPVVNTYQPNGLGSCEDFNSNGYPIKIENSTEQQCKHGWPNATWVAY